MNFNKCHLNIREDFYDDFDIKMLLKQFRQSGIKEGMVIFFKLLIKAGNDSDSSEDDDLCLMHLYQKISFIEELALYIDEENKNMQAVVDILLDLGFLEKKAEDKYIFYLPGGISVGMRSVTM